MVELLEQEDRPAYVRFERKAVENKKKTLQEGKTVYDDIDWIFVQIPYSRDVFEDKAVNWLEKQKNLVRQGRVPMKFYEFWEECYKRWKVGQEDPENGTDIRNWTIASPADVKNMQSVGIRTIEDMAACNAEGLQRLGMGGRRLKDKATSWLKGAGNQGKLALENAELTKKIEALELDLSSAQDRIRTLTYQLENKGDTVFEVGPIEDDTLGMEDVKSPERLKMEAMYQEKFSKKPHWNFSDETLMQKLSE